MRGYYNGDILVPEDTRAGVKVNKNISPGALEKILTKKGKNVIKLIFSEYSMNII